MLHKFVFRKGDVPLLYEITKKEKNVFNLIVPKAVFIAALGEYNEEVLMEHFGIKKHLSYCEDGGSIVLSFDLLQNRNLVMVSLGRIFDWFNNRDLITVTSGEENKQLMTFTIASSALAISLAPWTHELLANSQIARPVFEYALTQMKALNRAILGEKSAQDYIRYGYTEQGFNFQLFGNGLWFNGKYKDEIDTHNCDTHIDQATFFVGSIAICDALRFYLRNGTYLE